MILPIRLYSEKVLNTVCKPITDFTDPALELFIQDLLESMQANNGIGLAANQVGKDVQICALDLEGRTKKMILINPKIVTYSKETDVQVEGCLSCPGASIHMKRPIGVIVDSNLINGELIRYQFDGFDARVFFHEFDHLSGKTIVSGLQMLRPMI
jgi:peptide deformylase